MKSTLFVLIQFGALGLIAITGPLIPLNIWLLAIELAGIFLGIWAVFAMGIGNFNITPDVKRDSALVTAGPYKLIRHPMYSALLLTALPLVINSFSMFRLMVWILLLVDLLFKLSYEEGLLKKKHPDYSKYMETSDRLIPFLF